MNQIERGVLLREEGRLPPDRFLPYVHAYSRIKLRIESGKIQANKEILDKMENLSTRVAAAFMKTARPELEEAIRSNKGERAIQILRYCQVYAPRRGPTSQDAFYLAIDSGNRELVIELLSAFPVDIFAQVHQKPLLTWVLGKNDPKMTALLLSASLGRQFTEESVVSRASKLEVYKICNEERLKPQIIPALRFPSASTLCAASHRGDIEEIKALAARDKSALNQTDAYGMAPLHYAVHGGQPAVVQLLLNLGANPDTVTGEGETALHLAVDLPTGQDLLMVKQLLQGRANPNALDSKGRSSLHYAIEFLDIASELIKYKADLLIQSREKVTPLDIAKQRLLEAKESKKDRAIGHVRKLLEPIQDRWIRVAKSILGPRGLDIVNFYLGDIPGLLLCIILCRHILISGVEKRESGEKSYVDLSFQTIGAYYFIPFMHQISSVIFRVMQEINRPHLLKRLQEIAEVSVGNPKDMLLIQGSPDVDRNMLTHTKLAHLEQFAKNHNIEVVDDYSEKEIEKYTSIKKQFDVILINGHGWPKELRLTRNLTLYQRSKDLLRWLNDHAKTDSRIILQSCSTASGEHPIAQVISKACPQAIVYAPTKDIHKIWGMTLDQNLIPSFQYNFKDVTRVYRAGKLIHPVERQQKKPIPL